MSMLNQQNLLIMKYIPNTITLLNLLFGCMAIVCAFRCTDVIAGVDGYRLCFYCILLAAVADFCDGFCARMLGAYSELGKQLDSLSDLVSFGVAPALLLYNLFEAGGAPFSASLLCLLIPLMGALRLGRFNIDPSQSTTFKGLPIPSCALFCIGLAAMTVETPTGVNLYAASGSVLAVALLMVAPVKMYSLKFKSVGLRGNLLRYSLLVAALFCIGMLGWQGLYYLIGYYVLSSFVANLFTSDI